MKENGQEICRLQNTMRGGSASRGPGSAAAAAGALGEEDSAAAKAKAFSAKTKERNAKLAAAGKRHGAFLDQTSHDKRRSVPAAPTPPPLHLYNNSVSLSPCNENHIHGDPFVWDGVARSPPVTRRPPPLVDPCSTVAVCASTFQPPRALRVCPPPPPQPTYPRLMHSFSCN